MSFDGRLMAGASVLAAVVEGGSFVRAAEALGMSDSGISRAISRLEARIGVRLLDRTTRSVILTDEGRRFYEQAAPLMAGIEEAALTASGAAGAVRGRLRIDLEPLFARLVLAGHFGEFLDRHPELILDVITRENIGDLVTDGIDIAIRFGEPVMASAVARKLFETRVLTVAAPAYLERYGRPTHPAELSRHACIQFRNPANGRPFEWEFQREGEILPIRPGGRLMLSNAETLIGECRAGKGIAQVLALGLEEELEDGRLIDLFPDWPGEHFPLYALYPSRHHPPAKVRAFIDFVLEKLKAAETFGS
jgi:DNA-binding transcriptional LysR family regulator